MGSTRNGQCDPEWHEEGSAGLQADLLKRLRRLRLAAHSTRRLVQSEEGAASIWRRPTLHGPPMPLGLRRGLRCHRERTFQDALSSNHCCGGAVYLALIRHRRVSQLTAPYFLTTETYVEHAVCRSATLSIIAQGSYRSDGWRLIYPSRLSKRWPGLSVQLSSLDATLRPYLAFLSHSELAPLQD